MDAEKKYLGTFNINNYFMLICEPGAQLGDLGNQILKVNSDKWEIWVKQDGINEKVFLFISSSNSSLFDEKKLIKAYYNVTASSCLLGVFDIDSYAKLISSKSESDLLTLNSEWQKKVQKNKDNIYLTDNAFIFSTLAHGSFKYFIQMHEPELRVIAIKIIIDPF